MADQETNELGSKFEVGLLDKASRLQQPVCTLTIHRNVLGDLPLGGLSQILVSHEMTLISQLPVVVKLGCKGDPSDISISAV